MGYPPLFLETSIKLRIKSSTLLPPCPLWRRINRSCGHCHLHFQDWDQHLPLCFVSPRNDKRPSNQVGATKVGYWCMLISHMHFREWWGQDCECSCSQDFMSQSYNHHERESISVSTRLGIGLNHRSHRLVRPCEPGPQATRMRFSTLQLFAPKSPRNKKKTQKDVIQCLVPRGPVSVDFSAPASKFSWQILTHPNRWLAKKVSEAASLRTKGGVTTSTSDVAQLTLHFARDLPLWHSCRTNMPQLLLLTSISVAKAKPHQGLSKLQRCKALGTNLPTLLLRDQFAQQTHPEVCHDHKSQFKSRSS